MQTRITELFGIKYPIVQGGMHHVGFAELASAVSNAGGLGIITALTQPTPEALRAEIERCRGMTDKPFAVNLAFLPSTRPPDYPGYVKAIIEGGVKIVETAGNNPKEWMATFKEAGIVVIHKCTSIRHALTAERLGCDAISMDGFECAGHPGEDDVTNLILLPLCAQKLKVPFIASGGMVDGASLVAALSLGADGMNMGTRFMATKEAPIHQNVKDAIVAATERDTRLILRPLRNTERVLVNEAVERVIETEKRLGSEITFSDVAKEVAGVYPKIMKNGEVESGVWSCGQVVGLIDDIPTVKELIDRIVVQARSIIKERLPRML
ncbi:nitronate monooxygenase [Falsochrobactrum shanghaiense]|uniref:Nitronate monooxygenase n=1 Tax=Falsochrobactrum shanghaiense TaxID=2201899 RepID=A0A316J513_9HYPH|nr:nitronate monooxygenase family protein [Falsochrobactrum shanghaiense]PWL16476.1 nitronate monooxygenase [Falsochrobactrum shanghaiense]